MDSGAGSVFDVPNRMSFFDNKLYIANGPSDVTTCNWDSATNTLSGCVNTDVGGSAYGVVTYSLSNGTTYLFVSVEGSLITRCTIAQADGALSDCNPTGTTTIPNPRSLVIYNNTLYVADILTDIVLGCPINPTTGDLGACADTQVTPKGKYPAGLAINGGYLYIAYFDSNNVYKCLLTTLSTTVASPCELTGASALNGPPDLTFFNDGYGYITNYNSLNDGKAVTRCVVDATTGGLGSCEESSTFQLSNAFGIVFPPQT